MKAIYKYVQGKTQMLRPVFQTSPGTTVMGRESSHRTRISSWRESVKSWLVVVGGGRPLPFPPLPSLFVYMVLVITMTTDLSVAWSLVI